MTSRPARQTSSTEARGGGALRCPEARPPRGITLPAMFAVPRDLAGVVPFSALLETETDPVEREYLVEMQAACASFLTDQSWVDDVRQLFWGTGFPPRLGVFLANIGGADGVDPWLWVILGDVPPAYLVTDMAKTPQAALTLYCDLRDEWVTAVREGLPLVDLMPVDVLPTRDHADMLAVRIATLRGFIERGEV